MLVLLAAASLSAPVHARAQEQSDTRRQRPRRVEQAPPKPTTKPTLQRSPEDKEVKPPDSDVLRVDTNLVNVFFTAVDKNRRFVTTLGQQDVRVMEDGVPQKSRQICARSIRFLINLRPRVSATVGGALSASK